MLTHNKENMCWDFLGYGDESTEDEGNLILEAVEELVFSRGSWCGTAQELVTALQAMDSDLILQPNSLVRTLNAEVHHLKEHYEVVYSRFRKGNTKLIRLEPTEKTSDTSDVSDKSCHR